MATTGLRLDPADPAQRADPYPLYEHARKEEPVFFAPALGVWVVTRYDDALRVLMDPATFSSADALRGPTGPLPSEVASRLARGHLDIPVVIATDPPAHTRLRRLIGPMLLRTRIERLAPRIEALADELIDGFAGDGAADVVARFAWPFPLRVMGDAFGIAPDQLDELPTLIDDWIGLFRPRRPTPELLSRAEGVLALQQLFERLFQARAAAPRDDLASILLHARKRSPEVTSAELIGVPLAFFLGGHQTVTRALGSILFALTTGATSRPESDDALVPTIEEALRLESPTQAVFRMATREVVVSGYAIPKGARVLVHLGSANRDERRFHDAASFEPRRPDLSKHIAFGRGIHLCPGASLARLELKIGLGRLLRRLPDLRRERDGRADFDPLFLTRGYERLELAWNSATGVSRHDGALSS
jgi:cytochrome P450